MFMINLRKIGFILFFILMFGSVNGQDVAEDTLVPLTEILEKKKNSIGLRGGFLLTYSLNYQRKLSTRSALDVSFGHRPEGGFVRWGSENFTRTGGIVNYKYFLLLDEDPTGLIFFYLSGGFNATWVENTRVENNGYFNGGPILGVGLDLRFPRYTIDLGFMPGYDTFNGPNDGRFVWYKASGVSIRYLF